MIELQSVSKAYGARAAVHNLSLHIATGARTDALLQAARDAGYNLRHASATSIGITLDETTERLFIDSVQEAGTTTIEITFTGTLNDKLRGFYLSKGATRNYAVSQMEATDAFDLSREPAHIRAQYGDHVHGRQTLIARRLLELKPTLRIIGLSVHDQDHYPLALLQLGAAGFLSKRSSAREIADGVRRVASGWETELAIGMDSMFSVAALQPDIVDFYAIAQQTRLRVVQETLSGPWEALLDRRVDLLVGVGGALAG